MFNVPAIEVEDFDISKPTRLPPPSTFDEWLKCNNLDDWPFNDEEVINTKVEVTPDYFGVETNEDLEKTLRSCTPFNIAPLDGIISQLLSIEERFQKYSTSFFDSSGNVKRVRRDSPQRLFAKHKVKLPATQNEKNITEEKSLSKEPEAVEIKCIENAVCPGFSSHELTVLPNLEALQLLNFVTKLQRFTVSFKRNWDVHFLSQLSVAVLLDAFWWIFLDNKKSDKDLQAMFFNRLSSCFVSLFLNVPYSEKDAFFKHYPDCLSQALYAAFCAAYPESLKIFQEQFKVELINLVFEWTSELRESAMFWPSGRALMILGADGMQPTAREVLCKWDLDELVKQASSTNTQDEMGPNLKSSLSFDEETFYLPIKETDNVTANTKIRRPSSPKGANKTKYSSTRTKLVKESHPTGPRCDYTRVSFNIYGRSPLITHYLAWKEYQDEGSAPKKTVTRTQLQNSYIDTTETYEEVIKKYRNDSRLRKNELDRLLTDVGKSCKAVKKNKTYEQNVLINAHDKLLARNIDVKILSQQLMDRMSDFTTRSNGTVKANEDSKDVLEK